MCGSGPRWRVAAQHAAGAHAAPGAAALPCQVAGQFVPKWDFDAPYSAALDGPRDTAAAAVAALGLLHLSELAPPLVGGDGSPQQQPGCADRYLCAAVNTLRELAGPKYLSTPGVGGPSLLKHGTGNAPHGFEIDTGLIYGKWARLRARTACMHVALVTVLLAPQRAHCAFECALLCLR